MVESKSRSERHRPLSPRFKKTLSAVVGRKGLKTNPADLYVHSFDATGQPALPEVVVIPRTTGELVEVLRQCWSAGVFVTLRGAGTGFSGGAVPVQGGVLVVCDRLKRLLSDDGDAVSLEPGVVGDDLNRYLAPTGRFYPVDPASAEVSTLGGHVAENAGGPRALKYGVTRDYVQQLEVLSPARGREVYRATPGEVDMLSVLIGSEGTLAATLALTLRVLPLPEATAVVVAAFQDAVAAAGAAGAVLSSGMTPAKLEFLDERTVTCVERKEPGSLPRAAAAVLIVEYDGNAKAVREHVRGAAMLLREHGAMDVAVGEEPAMIDRLTRARRGVSPALGLIAPNKKNEDVCVPLSRVPELVAWLRELEEKQGLVIPTFGHIGDGNLHVNFMYDARDRDWAARVERGVEELMGKVIGLGGTITGEHGVGIAKKRYLELEYGAAEYARAREVKWHFDPRGLLNPGKMW